MCHCRRYGFTNFLFDCVMIALTCGLWIFWMMIRHRGCHR